MFLFENGPNWMMFGWVVG